MEIRKVLESLPSDIVDKENKQQLIEVKKQHNEFLAAFNKGCCYLCGMKISYFNEYEKCFHWFLLPKGIRKKYFRDYLKDPIGFIQLESYLRWVAETEGYFKNINDLSNNNPNGKLLETTIKYKNIEWSMNFGKTDLEGHHDSKYTDFPHFHIQILIDDRPFIGFNDFHIPFSDYDLFRFEAFKNEDLIEHHRIYGEGMSVIEDEDKLRIIEDNLVPSNSEMEGTFHTQTFFEMPEGESITAEELDNIKKESKERGITLRKLLKEKIPNIKLLVKNVSPAKGVVTKKVRNKRK